MWSRSYQRLYSTSRPTPGSVSTNNMLPTRIGYSFGGFATSVLLGVRHGVESEGVAVGHEVAGARRREVRADHERVGVGVLGEEPAAGGFRLRGVDVGGRGPRRLGELHR